MGLKKLVSTGLSPVWEMRGVPGEEEKREDLNETASATLIGIGRLQE